MRSKSMRAKEGRKEGRKGGRKEGGREEHLALVSEEKSPEKTSAPALSIVSRSQALSVYRVSAL
eukprot:scaffold253_cov243-Pinguiococcus_pyrenoidosus.AAC.6